MSIPETQRMRIQKLLNLAEAMQFILDVQTIQNSQSTFESNTNIKATTLSLVFGCMAFEILNGKKLSEFSNTDFQRILTGLRPLKKSINSYFLLSTKILEMIQLCYQADVDERPSLNQIIAILRTELELTSGQENEVSDELNKTQVPLVAHSVTQALQVSEWSQDTTQSMLNTSAFGQFYKEAEVYANPDFLKAIESLYTRYKYLLIYDCTDVIVQIDEYIKTIIFDDMAAVNQLSVLMDQLETHARDETRTRNTVIASTPETVMVTPQKQVKVQPRACLSTEEKISAFRERRPLEIVQNSHLQTNGQQIVMGDSLIYTLLKLHFKSPVNQQTKMTHETVQQTPKETKKTVIPDRASSSKDLHELFESAKTRTPHDNVLNQAFERAKKQNGSLDMTEQPRQRTEQESPKIDNKGLNRINKLMHLFGDPARYQHDQNRITV